MGASLMAGFVTDRRSYSCSYSHDVRDVRLPDALRSVHGALHSDICGDSGSDSNNLRKSNTYLFGLHVIFIVNAVGNRLKFARIFLARQG